ncbi:Dual specificity protein kinase shkA [Babesia sp. Xinjiang]|uniref:Dual specificity protein kinase shkA n=1 Tax=Babesia sp. Xinjiang TaxID=462227 RepID=UPI000A21EFDA|nr:Dual specificity protein kinase shkA [Babesia sp. Xinjiang]ORM40245.1 Dual specificity protein kinase shkA [Babesia sp. Xinjiang]
MDKQNTCAKGVYRHMVSKAQATCDDVQVGPMILHDGSRVGHGITSAETVSTYRSDLCDEKLADVKDSRAKVVEASGTTNRRLIWHHENDIPSHATVNSNVNPTGCRYSGSVVTPEQSLGLPIDDVAATGREVAGNKGDRTAVDQSKTTEEYDLISNTREAFAAVTLKGKDDRSLGAMNINRYNDLDRGFFKQTHYTKNGVVSSHQRQTCDGVFKRNKCERGSLIRGQSDVDVTPTRFFQLKDVGSLRNRPTRVSARRPSGFFWHKPFGTTHRERVAFFRGLPYVETLNPGVQKSWHLEAISALTREQYASLKMTMLRLTKGGTNVDPKLLIMLSRGSWEVLQEGTFGTVYIGFLEGLGNCAVKVPVSLMVQQDPVGVMRRYINEWDILSRCDHPNIVKLRGGLIFGVFDIWLCTELIKGADLHSIKYGQHSKRLITTKAGLKMCRQLANAILYLHTPTAERGKIVHRDIKPENVIVMPNWTIKLCDFGDAWENTSGFVDNISGATWLYAPPELLKHKSIMVDIVGLSGGEETDLVELSEKWDIWSMGCVFQEMFGYAGPFHYLVDVQDEPAQICEKMVLNAIKGLVPRIPHTLAVTKMGQLISQCLHNDARLRPTAAQICAVLQAPDATLLS